MRFEFQSIYYGGDSIVKLIKKGKIMKRNESDISLLLTVLILLSASIGLLHGLKFTSVGAEDKSGSELSLSPQDGMDIVQPLLDSQNYIGVARAFGQFDINTQKSLLDRLLFGDTGSYTKEQKVKIVAAILRETKNDRMKEYSIDLLAQYFPQDPIFLYAFPEFGIFIPTIKEAMDKRGKNSLYNSWKNQSLTELIRFNRPDLLEFMYINGVRLTSKEASNMLDVIVSLEKEPAFVPLLIKQFGANPNFSSDRKRTVLMKAAQSRNKGLYKALIDLGANEGLILDSSIGSAEQIAAQKNL